MTGAPLRRAGEEFEGRDGDRALGGLCRRGPAQPGLQRCTADRERSKVCAGSSPSVGRGLLEAEGVRFASKLGFSLVANRNPLLVHKVLAASGDQGLPQKQVGVLSALLCEWRSTDKRLAASRLCCHRVALSAIRRRMHRRSSSRQSRRATGGGGARRWTSLRKSLPFPPAFASRALCVRA